MGTPHEGLPSNTKGHMGAAEGHCPLEREATKNTVAVGFIFPDLRQCRKAV